jgi:predicted dehydrogenase
VVVATPPDTHPDISLFFVERGAHVLCEKPLSVCLSDAQRMLDGAKRAGVHLTMGSKFRHSDDVVRAKSLVASGVLGEVVRLENVFTSKVDMTSRWNSLKAVGGGGVLIDNGTHSADIMRFMTGPITQVFATEAPRIQRMEVEDTVHVACRSASGVLGTFDLTWSTNVFASDYLRIWGSDGLLCVGWAESRYRNFGSSDWVVFGKGYNKVQGLKAQLENFSRTIRGEDTLHIAPEDVLASVHVIDACYQSLRSGGWVTVNGQSGKPGAVHAGTRNGAA